MHEGISPLPINHKSKIENLNLRGANPMEIKKVMAKIRWALEEAAKGNVDALDQIHDPDIVYHLYPFWYQSTVSVPPTGKAVVF